ncbi:hypothetical protein VNO77_22934 [Canavalia gladiata]|uniref:Uncharacterized protein n=1 Tax=Canavalia gladiata TaxID=3824 RepID=A0AAN9L3I8_CANGL
MSLLFELRFFLDRLDHANRYQGSYQTCLEEDSNGARLCCGAKLATVLTKHTLTIESITMISSKDYLGVMMMKILMVQCVEALKYLIPYT